MPYNWMVDEFKKYFNYTVFEHITIVHDKAVDAMATIGSLLDMLDNVSQYILGKTTIDPYFQNYKSKIM